MTAILKNVIKSIIKIANPDRIILFGSRADGKAKEGSDYDLLVLKNNVADKRKLGKKIYMNLDYVGAAIDLIVEESSVFNKQSLIPYKMYCEIAETGKVVYEKQP